MYRTRWLSRRLARANGGGLIYIEVPCFEWILRARAWFDIFYEHVNYFRLGDFSKMFGHVVDGGHLFGGQYLYVVADLATLRPPVSSLADRVDFPEDFLATVSVVPFRPGGRIECRLGRGIERCHLFAVAGTLR